MMILLAFAIVFAALAGLGIPSGRYSFIGLSLLCYYLSKIFT